MDARRGRRGGRMKTLGEALDAFYSDVRAIYGNDAKVSVVIATPIGGPNFHFHINGNDVNLTGSMIISAAEIVRAASVGTPATVKGH